MAQGRGVLLPLGFDYLKTGAFELGRRGKISSGNGVGLAQAYLAPRHESSIAHRRKEILDRYLEEIRATKQSVILSSEFFNAVPPKLLGELAEALSAEGEVSLVYFVRDQLSLMASTYVQRVKRHGLTEFPEAFFANWDHFKPSLKYFSYLQMVAEAAPNARILARPYEAAQQTDGGLIGLFLQLLDLPCPEPLRSLDKPVNISPSPHEIRMLIEINKHRPRMEFSDMVVEASARAGRNLAQSSIAIMPPALRRDVRAFFAEENEAFFKQYLGSENLYTADASDQAFIDLSTMSFSATEVLMILSGLMIEMDRRIAELESRTPAAE